MPTVTFVAADGSSRSVQAAAGSCLMQAAVNSNIDGIVAECGGAASCATCHVYVEAPWAARLPPPNAIENEMLECTASERRPESRLSCQLSMSDELDGIVLRLPQTQV